MGGRGKIEEMLYRLYRFYIDVFRFRIEKDLDGYGGVGRIGVGRERIGKRKICRIRQGGFAQILPWTPKNI